MRVVLLLVLVACALVCAVVLLIMVFEVVFAFKIALQGFTPTDGWVKAQEILIDLLLFASISLLCQSLWLTSISLLIPWRSDGQRVGSTVNLPAEYCKHGCRMRIVPRAWSVRRSLSSRLCSLHLSLALVCCSVAPVSSF